MSLAPVSDIAVSEIAMWFGVGLQLGIEVKFLVTSEFLSLLGLELIKLFLNVLDPCRQVVNASQTLFFIFPGPEGLARVAKLLYPATTSLQSTATRPPAPTLQAPAKQRTRAGMHSPPDGMGTTHSEKV